jgi:4-amino-4-deoxy-L-arabinose transferase-like glycosyltransferase
MNKKHIPLIACITLSFLALLRSLERGNFFQILLAAIGFMLFLFLLVGLKFKKQD